MFKAYFREAYLMYVLIRYDGGYKTFVLVLFLDEKNQLKIMTYFLSLKEKRSGKNKNLFFKPHFDTSTKFQNQNL